MFVLLSMRVLDRATVLLCNTVPCFTYVCSHSPQNQHLLFYIQACSNFLVTLHGNVFRNRNIHHKFNALFKSI
jgi:imidazoleglycerol phosphate dehydratase HisB